MNYSFSTNTEPSAQSRIEELLARGDVHEALALAKELHKTSHLNVACAESLLKAAREWHAHGMLSEQQEACERVLAVVPEHFEALHLLGYGAQTQGEMERAETYFTRAVASNPDYPFARLALAQMQMMRTQFVQGRGDYEARFDAVTEGSGPDWRGLPITRWRGESLQGKKIYLWAEQGLGDIVMFAGFLPFILKQSPARVALGMFPKLNSLFARSFPSIDIELIDDAIHHALAPSVMGAFPHIEKLSQLATVPFSIEPLRAAYDYVQRHGLFDFAAPMGDLLVHAMPGFIPANQPPYLIADPIRVATVRKHLNTQGQGRRIGISWHTTNRRELVRNIPLQQWLPLLATPGCHFVSLQHNVDEEKIKQFCAQHGCRITINTGIDPLADAEGLAALIAAQDAVITIDNSNVHLAGALGVSTALLLPKGHNYRWPLLPENKTLWYKNVATLRQQEAFDWKPVMQMAAAWLRD